MSRFFRLSRVAAVLAVMLAACGEPPGQGQPGDAGGPPPMPVDVAAPLVKDVVLWDEFTGRFEAAKLVELRARVTGYIKSVHFDEGQSVKEGDLLFTIDPRPFEASLQRARAELRDALAAGELARAELKRTEGLIGTSALSEERLDTRRAAREQAEARVAGARANVRSAELDLEFTEVRAPISGRISESRIDVGNLVTSTAGQADILAVLVALDPIYVVFNPSEADYLRYSRMFGGGPISAETSKQVRVQLQLMNESGWSRDGWLDFVDNRLGAGTGTIRVRAVFENPNGLLLPGMFARVRIAGTDAEPLILVPDAAVLADQNARIVLTVGPDGKVVPKPVVLGPTVGRLRVIREGLGPEDRVIVNGIQRAQPGGTVVPQAARIADDGTVASTAPQTQKSVR